MNKQSDESFVSWATRLTEHCQESSRIQLLAAAIQADAHIEAAKLIADGLVRASDYIAYSAGRQLCDIMPIAPHPVPPNTPGYTPITCEG